ncbi:MerR family transcriptional regulator [candidate division KSB1 bacterium]|nr:MerR family transcriptional regulator [candidate division KSB1 bacterium]
MYPIKAVALKTGLTTHTIRVWERRYEIVHPVRTASNRRLYSETDVRKLALLKKATAAGHGIGQLSRMPLEEIERLVREFTIAHASSIATPFSSAEQAPAFFVDAALAASEAFDNEVLDDILTRASVNFSQATLIDQMLIPFLNILGEKWCTGAIQVAQEHAASAVVRTFLGRLLGSIRMQRQGPVLVAATLSGLHHEFGAMLAAITAASQGWCSHYLGANLPVEEIAFSAEKITAHVVVISIVYPAGDDEVRDQLLQLRQLLRDDVAFILSGRAVASYEETVRNINALVCHDTAELRQELAALQDHFVNGI